VRGQKIGSFGFLRWDCESAKTKCAYLRVGFFSMLHNGLALGAVEEIEALNCQPAQMPNRSIALDLTTAPAIALNARCGLLFIFSYT
jgi:hypothetical protein